jgi:hypothetical protein
MAAITRVRRPGLAAAGIGVGCEPSHAHRCDSHRPSWQGHRLRRRITDTTVDLAAQIAS